MTTYWRGHSIVEDNGKWRYEDNGCLVSEFPDRPCGFCGLPNTPEGHDGCIPSLPGVMNACCGHGVPRDSYVQLAPDDKVTV